MAITMNSRPAPTALQSGCSFVILNQIQFARDLLPLFFKHSNMASFIRQLNMYGFRKIPLVSSDGSEHHSDVAQFYHVNFTRGQEQRLASIKRKNNSVGRSHNLVVSGNFYEEVRAILGEVKSIREGQLSSESIMGPIKADNKSLWRDLDTLRGQHHKQRHVIEKLVQFLLSLIENRNNSIIKRRKNLMIGQNGAAINHHNSHQQVVVSTHGSVNGVDGGDAPGVISSVANSNHHHQLQRQAAATSSASGSSLVTVSHPTALTERSLSVNTDTPTAPATVGGGGGSILSHHQNHHLLQEQLASDLGLSMQSSAVQVSRFTGQPRAHSAVLGAMLADCSSPVGNENINSREANYAPTGGGGAGGCGSISLQFSGSGAGGTATLVANSAGSLSLCEPIGSVQSLHCASNLLLDPHGQQQPGQQHILHQHSLNARSASCTGQHLSQWTANSIYNTMVANHNGGGSGATTNHTGGGSAALFSDSRAGANGGLLSAGHSPAASSVALGDNGGLASPITSIVAAAAAASSVGPPGGGAASHQAHTGSSSRNSNSSNHLHHAHNHLHPSNLQQLQQQQQQQQPQSHQQMHSCLYRETAISTDAHSSGGPELEAQVAPSGVYCAS